MGREIRRVPKNWKHPVYHADNAPKPKDVGVFKPLHNDYDKTLAAFAAMVEKDGLAEAIEYYGGGPLEEEYACYEGKPLEWWQLYETVTEGTPLTPAFATPEELVEYLVAKGDGWYHTPWPRERAEAMVSEGWAPSMIIKNGVIYEGAAALVAMKKDAK